MVILYLVLVVTSMALAVLLCINDRAPRSNLGEMPRSIFATIVPQNCNMNLAAPAKPSAKKQKARF